MRLSAVVVLIAMMVLTPLVGGAATAAQTGQATPTAGEAAELVVDEERYLFDREVPINVADLDELADEDDNPVFAKTDDPLNAVYVPVPGEDDLAARYLPENLNEPDTQCPNELTDAGIIEGGDGTVFVPAGPEFDIPVDGLVEIGSTNEGQTIFAESQDQPFDELFATTEGEDEPVRYIRLSEDGPPATFPVVQSFAGQEFDVVLDGGEGVDTGDLNKVGCVGPFPAFSEQSEAPFNAFFLQLGDVVVEYQATEPVDITDETPSPEATGTPVPDTGTITVQKRFCEAPSEEGGEDADLECLGPIGAVESAVVAFEVRQGEATEGDAVLTIEVEIFAEGDVSQGEQTSEPLPLGVYTVCEVPLDGFDPVARVADEGDEESTPALTAVEGEPCITVALAPGDNLLQFDNVEIAAATPSPTATATTAPTATATATATATSTATATATLTPTTAPPTATATATATATGTTPPTATGTTAPTATGTAAPTATGTTAPTATGTTVPAATGTTAPTAPAATVAPTLPSGQRPTPTPRVFQPPAVVPTLAPNVPPPPVSTATTTRCQGDPGQLSASGLPERLPGSIQYGGRGYRFTGAVPIAEGGELTLIGCVGGFEAYSSDQADASQVLFLSLPGSADIFRYQAGATFRVRAEVEDEPRIITLLPTEGEAEVNYRASAPWVRSVYSSVTQILYVADPENEQPERIFGRAVDADAIAEYVPAEAVESEPSEELTAAALDLGLNPELLLGSGETQRYVLVAIWAPFGTTTNGWVTLYAPQGEDAPPLLCGVDPRRLDLLIFERTE